MEEEKLVVQKKQWYKENNVKLYLDKKVADVDPKKKEITLTDRTRISYSKLLLANGASNFTPPIKGIDKVRVFTLRTLDGAFNILDYLKDIKTILLIGGGIQNL